jgi:hypothetical protein
MCYYFIDMAYFYRWLLILESIFFLLSRFWHKIIHLCVCVREFVNWIKYELEQRERVSGIFFNKNFFWKEKNSRKIVNVSLEQQSQIIDKYFPMKIWWLPLWRKEEKLFNSSNSLWNSQSFTLTLLLPKCLSCLKILHVFVFFWFFLWHTYDVD